MSKDEIRVITLEDMQMQPSFRHFPPSPDGITIASGRDSDGDSQLLLRPDSPSPSVSPTTALRARPQLPRSFSTGSSASAFSSRSSSLPRDDYGTAPARHFSGTYTLRQSSGGLERPNRRGYVRPQGTNFAASAQSRESVLSLGSIAHLQHYFARTGLLDGKGGRLARKKDPNGLLDLSPTMSDRDSSYSSMRSSPELSALGIGDSIVESPTEEGNAYYSEEEDVEMLPPTVSTYNYRPKPIPRPPTLAELKADLTQTLKAAQLVLADAKAIQSMTPPSPPRRSESDNTGNTESPLRPSPNQGWYELQGMNILDLVTLAIRAAKRYYTAHDDPTRLSAIKSERKIRTELLSVMEVLRRMATRNFAHGMRTEERVTMEVWMEGVWDMLRREDEMEEQQKEQRRSWTWLDDRLWPPETPVSGTTVTIEREYAFLKSMDPSPESLPAYSASNFSTMAESPLTADPEPKRLSPSPFLAEFQNGVRLIKLHNALVQISKRPFGAIPTFHTDTGKPYRCSENLRFWIKAAELRWEVVLKVDVMGVVNGTSKEAWEGFEAAIWKWTRKVREELAVELR